MLYRPRTHTACTPQTHPGRGSLAPPLSCTLRNNSFHSFQLVEGPCATTIDVMNVGVIGAGRVGSTLGKGFSKAGHDVRYGLRDPSKNPDALSIRDAVQWADIVVLAVPFGAAQGAVEAGGDFAGKPLLDATNPIGPGLSLLHGHDDSGAERVAAWATNANVVKISRKSKPKAET